MGGQTGGQVAADSCCTALQPPIVELSMYVFVCQLVQQPALPLLFLLLLVGCTAALPQSRVTFPTDLVQLAACPVALQALVLHQAGDESTQVVIVCQGAPDHLRRA